MEVQLNYLKELELKEKKKKNKREDFRKEEKIRTV